MRLTVLGSSGGAPTRSNPASGYLVSHGETAIWCEAGPGTFMRLGGIIDPGHLDAVIASHVHPDHCADVLALFGYLAYGPGGPGPIPVYVPEGVVDGIASFVRAGEGHPLFSVRDFRVVGDGDEAIIGGVSVRFAATNHSVPTIASRFTAGGRSLVYSADTGPGGGFPLLADGADVGLVEATLSGDREPGDYAYHLTAAEAGAAAAARLNRLILTHLSPRVDARAAAAEAASTFGAEPDVAAPGMSVTV